MPLRFFVRYARAGLFLLLVSLCSYASSQSTAAPDSQVFDVRLVIDVSGSMKANDPNNLRQPAVELLVELLPEGSKAGVWTFGKWVNMLIPHKPVGDSWRASARDSSKKINSVGLYTNIGLALEKAAYDLNYVDPAQEKHIILLTDGMVDVDKDQAANRKEWRRIVDTVLPDLKAAGYTIHTIALSKNADRDLMDRLSVGTDGVADLAESADDLMKIFLKAFDAAVPSEQVALTDNSFIIDSSVEEFTALIFREGQGSKTELITPDNQTWRDSSASNDLSWHRTPNYDLITVRRPIEGEWGVVGEIAPDSRITVVSNLNLRLSPLPNNVLKGAELDVLALLQEDGATIANPDFLSLLDIKAELFGGNNFDSLVSLWDQPVKPTSPSEGRYEVRLPALDKEGVYLVKLSVDGKTFSRELKHQITLRQAFSADVREQFEEGAINYVLTVNAYTEGINYSKTQIIAAITLPSGQKIVRPMQISELDAWQTKFVPESEGTYSARVQVKGISVDGGTFEYELDPVTFTYSLEGGMVEQQPSFQEPESEPETTPEATPEATPAATPEGEASPEASEPVEDSIEQPASSALSKWILYAALGLGNLILMGAGFFAFKKIMSGPKDDILDELDDNDEDESAAAVAESPELEAPEEDEEEEPPMEDLDAEPAEPEPKPEPEMLEQETLESETLEPIEPEGDAFPTLEPEDTSSDGIDDEPEMTMEEAMAMEAGGDSDVTDLDSGLADDEEMDDLDAMAMEIAQEAEASNESSEDDGEADDMVSEMLKAQGLDLAEDELDEAISSLIDDLEDDDEDEDKKL